MPGSFSKENRPVRPGAYFNWEAEPTTTIPPNIGSVVCLPIVHDWGPENTIIACLSLGDFQTKFGPSTNTPGYAAVMQCFKGEGVSGRGGAGEILVYRMTGASAAPGTLALSNGTSPAITLTARYSGSYSNNLGVYVRPGTPPTQVEVLVTLGGAIVAIHSGLAADIDGLAANINQTSRWVTAEVQNNSQPLSVANPSTLQQFSGGDDGATLTPLQWASMLDAISAARFSLFAPYDLTENTVLQAIQAWSATLNSSGKRFMTVVGGDANDTAMTAIDRSIMLGGLGAGGNGGGENFVNLGVGTLIDDQLGELTTSQLAPRIAGILAARGETMSLTFARMQGCSLSDKVASDSDVALCFDGGVVCFGQDSNADSPVRVEKGLTCYVGGDDSKPYLIYRNPKFVRTMHGIELDITDWSTASAIGLLQVNDQTRALVVGYGHQVMEQRAGLGVIQDDYSVGIDPVPPPSDDDEFIAVVYGIAFGRSVEQIYNTVYIT